MLLCSYELCPAGEKPGAKSDAEAIQGEWRVVYGEMDGKALAPEIYKGQTWTFGAQKISMGRNGQEVISVRYKLDTAKQPKQIDVAAEGRSGSGIYKLEGDTLTVCAPTGPDSETIARPSEFKTKPGSSTVLTKFERVKK
jgi:uncharacterized protein (TIGR03067 family)